MKRFKPRTSDALMLAIDANRVIGLRFAKLMLGGKGAQREAKLLMVTENAKRLSYAGSEVVITTSDGRTSHSLPSALPDTP